MNRLSQHDKMRWIAEIMIHIPPCRDGESIAISTAAYKSGRHKTRGTQLMREYVGANLKFFNIMHDEKLNITKCCLTENGLEKRREFDIVLRNMQESDDLLSRG